MNKTGTCVIEILSEQARCTKESGTSAADRSIVAQVVVIWADLAVTLAVNTHDRSGTQHKRLYRNTDLTLPSHRKYQRFEEYSETAGRHGYNETGR